jgi:hypothetical protein
MSDANKNNPGGHGHDPMQQLWMAMTGASTGHHEEVPGVDPQATKVGHEADQFDARTIVGVPIVVSITLVFTYLLVQGAFAFVNGKSTRQENDPNFNDRAARIRTTDAKPLPAISGETPLPGVAQPGLERVQTVDVMRKDANGTDVSDPPYLRSFLPTPTGNSPYIYPEDLRAEHFVDPTTHKKALVEPSWVVKDKVATISIDEAIHLMTTNDQFKLKANEKGTTPKAGTIGKARLSSGGVATPTPTEKKDEPKKDDHK